MRGSKHTAFGLGLMVLYLGIPAAFILPSLVRARDTEISRDMNLYETGPFVAESDPSNMRDDGEIILAEAPTNFNQPAVDAGSSELNGFADTPWMTDYSAVKKRFQDLATAANTPERIEIVMAVEDHYILVRRNDVLYRYNFYKSPITVARLNNHELTEADYDSMEGKLYHVRVILPFIQSKWIGERLEKAYGQKTRSTVDEKTMRGADIWEKPGGFIFQWFEPYHKVAYSRTIDYMSADMVKKIMQENEKYFDAEERELLRKLIVN
ncbi:MAG: hypothetical protein KDK37_02755 [Leptospiraceae bacterium]|nr:hypothetical protein [Leptospiraceae bacterium]MCB1303165.1 hypothetical protein [Leptospiraceae bacterium]